LVDAAGSGQGYDYGDGEGGEGGRGGWTRIVSVIANEAVDISLLPDYERFRSINS
jgi:hypothetical protein